MTPFINLAAGRGTFAPFTLIGIDGTGATVTGTFTIAVTVTTSATVNGITTTPDINRGGVGAPGVGGGNLINPGETFTVSNPILTSVSGAPASAFQFDGFTGIFVGAVDAGEEAIVNGGTPFEPTLTGNSLLPTNATEDPFTPFALSPTATLGSSVGGFSFNGVEAQFSAVVPEPSSVALLGLSGLVLLRRRR